VARVKTKSGKVLTRKDIEALADEAEAGYDLSKATRELAPGRPSLGKGVSPRISYRVPERLYSRARAKAKKEGRTVSELARDALEKYISG
jgi:hypothetical protein